MDRKKKTLLTSISALIGIFLAGVFSMHYLKLHKELTRTEDLKNTLQKTALTANNNLKQASEELTKARSELLRAQKELTDIEKTQVGPLREKAEQMKESLLIRDTQLSELRKALEVNEETNASLRANNEILRTQIEGLQSQRGITKDEQLEAGPLTRQASTKSALNARKPNSKSAKEALGLTRRLSQISAYSKKQEEEIRMLTLKVSKLENMVDVLERNLFLARAEVVEKKSALDLLGVQKDMLNADIAQWDQERVRLEQAKDLQVKNAGLLARLEGSAKELSAKQRQIESLKKNLESLRSEVLRKDEKVRVLEVDLATLGSQKNELREQLVNQQVLLEETSALSGGLKERLSELSRLLAEKEFLLEKNNDTIALLEEELSDARARKIRVYDAANAEKSRAQELKKKLESILNPNS